MGLWKCIFANGNVYEGGGINDLMDDREEGGGRKIRV